MAACIEFRVSRGTPKKITRKVPVTDFFNHKKSNWDGQEATPEGNISSSSPPTASCCDNLTDLLRSSNQLQGKVGTAAIYLTRNQALKKLQLTLSEFRYQAHKISTHKEGSYVSWRVFILANPRRRTKEETRRITWRKISFTWCTILLSLYGL